MTRDEFATELLTLRNFVAIQISLEHPPIPKNATSEQREALVAALNEKLMLALKGFAIFEGIVDAILEIRDNTRGPPVHDLK